MIDYYLIESLHSITLKSFGILVRSKFRCLVQHSKSSKCSLIFCHRSAARQTRSTRQWDILDLYCRNHFLFHGAVERPSTLALTTQRSSLASASVTISVSEVRLIAVTPRLPQLFWQRRLKSLIWLCIAPFHHPRQRSNGMVWSAF